VSGPKLNGYKVPEQWVPLAGPRSAIYQPEERSPDPAGLAMLWAMVLGTLLLIGVSVGALAWLAYAVLMAVGR
jgi:hypothetical protein